MSPELAWQVCLKKMGTELELLTDLDMLLMFERGTRGGITEAVHRYAEANNKYMGDKFIPKEDSNYLQYLDVINLYGWVMTQLLPTGDLIGLIRVNLHLIRLIAMKIGIVRVIYERSMLGNPRNYPISITTFHLCVKR